MATYRIDIGKAEELLRRYRPDAVTRMAHGHTELQFLCPYHAETQPSFSINLDKGVGRCFSCGVTAHFKGLVAKLENGSEEAADRLLKKQEIFIKEEAASEDKEIKKQKEQRRKLLSCGFTQADVEGFHIKLMENATKRQELQKATGWSDETLARWKIGLDGERFTLPAMIDEIVHNIKYYKPNGLPKYSGVAGYNQMYLWPLANMKAEEIWLMEGEKDCILANQCGLNAVTFSGGASSLPKEFIHYFKDKKVNVVYDIDDAGKAGAKEVADILSRVAYSVKIVDLPAQGLPPNGDFSDFVNIAKGHAVDVQQLSNLTDSHVFSAGSAMIIPPDIIDTYLERIIPDKLFFKRVRMRVRVVSVLSDKTYVVPEEVKVKCDKNWLDNCSACPLFYKQGEDTIKMKPEYQEILLLVETNTQAQRKVVARIMEILDKCPRYKIETSKHQYMYPVVFIPALEKDKPYHSYMMQQAWSFSEPATANEDYLAESIVMCHPDTQQMVLITYKLEKDLASADEFELSPEQRDQLKIFQPVLEPVCQPNLLLSTHVSPRSTTISQTTSPTSTEDKTSTSP